MTALYEIVPAGEPLDGAGRRSAEVPAPADAGRRPRTRDELLTVKLRYKEPDGDASRLMSVPVKDRATGALSANLGFAAAVAEFGMLLRESEYRGTATLCRRRGARAKIPR